MLAYLGNEASLTPERLAALKQQFREFGLPDCRRILGGREWGSLEKALERNEPQDFFLNPEAEIAPVLRKALTSSS